MIRALLVDDEPLVRERVRVLLGAQADVQVVGECGDGISAMNAVRELKPDLLFLDIQMPGPGGLEVVETLRQEGILPLVVFITAYDQYAMAAFRLQALDYLLKPFDPELFHRSLDHVRTMMAGKERNDLDQRLHALLAAHEAHRARVPHLVVREGERYRLIRTADIQCIEATGNYACLHCGDGTFFLRSTLGTLEARLDPERFFRTHRSWIVNLDHVREAQPWAKGSWVLLTHGKHKVPLSPQHRDALSRIFSAET